MRILMTTWEYPPVKVGGIGSHVHDLSKALVRMGHDVHILTYGNTNKENYDMGITIHRLKAVENATDTITWSVALSHKMEKEAIRLHKLHKFDVVHAHDWMMVPAGSGIKKLLNIPFVFTIHSTEHGRSGIHDAYTKMINDLEWYGTYEAHQVITVGKDFSKEVKALFRVPDEKLHYIPNGVDIKKFDMPKLPAERSDYVADWEKMIFFCGRMTYVKGVDHLIEAMPSILKEHPDSKFVLAGKGPDLPRYIQKVKSLGIAEKTYFTGYVDDDTLIALYRMADLTVAPSLYEPFGIVALESAAAKKPTIGSYIGGLKETIVNEYTGLHTWAGNPNSIADQVSRVLWDDSWRKWLGTNGRKHVEANFRWDRIAHWTTGVYGKALGIW
ncbi:MAG: glycosyltransferase family 4 protein [Candidatus Micrarchaeota archaeon]|nr:glycosyltransferase family 4 protein [Candidatus Micrarchaeota archaeon]